MNTLGSIKTRAFRNTCENEDCFNSFMFDCFSILDTASTESQSKIKEGMYFDRDKANLNKKFNHLATTLSL